MKFTLALAGLLLIAVSSSSRPSTARAAWRVSQFENVLGTSLELKFAVASDNEAARAEASSPDVETAEDFLRLRVIGELVAEAVEKDGRAKKRDALRREREEVNHTSVSTGRARAAISRQS